MMKRNLTLLVTLVGLSILLASCGKRDEPSSTGREKATTATPTPNSLQPTKPGPENVALSFDQGVYMATHNSYSGEERKSIKEQLDLGVRFIELDVWSDHFETDRDWHVGHDKIGHEVELGNGNPNDTRLTSWLNVINTWSNTHSKHAPLVVSLDLKTGLSVQSTNGADANSLDRLLESVFKGKLFSPQGLDQQWPSLDAMRGRIVVMLSGHRASRKTYQHRSQRVAFTDFQKGDEGSTPEHFVGVRTGEAGDLAQFAGPGRLTRVWRFGDEASDYAFRVHFPATDRPFSEPYKSYCEKHQCVQ